MAHGQNGHNVPSPAQQGKKELCKLEVVAALVKTVKKIVLEAQLVSIDFSVGHRHEFCGYW